jgi:hypothetical protein
MEILHGARAPGRGPFVGREMGPNIFWGTLQAIGEMRKFRESNFSAHPALSHILNLHLQDNSVTKSEMTAALDKIKDLTADVTLLKSAADIKVTANNTGNNARGGGAGTPRVGGRLALAESLTDLAEAQVELNVDSTVNGILFGIVGETESQRWWSSFTGRFGKIEWKMPASDGGPVERDKALAKILQTTEVDVILMESGRLRRGSPIWTSPRVVVVMSIDGW